MKRTSVYLINLSDTLGQHDYELLYKLGGSKETENEGI